MIDDGLVFVDGRTGGVNCVEVLDLGEGLTLNLDIPGSSDLDPCLVCAGILRRLGVPVSPKRLALFIPEEMRDAMMWATAELLHRTLDGGRPARRPMPACLARTMGPRG